MKKRLAYLFSLAILLAACSSGSGTPDAGSSPDSASRDAEVTEPDQDVSEPRDVPPRPDVPDLLVPPDETTPLDAGDVPPPPDVQEEIDTAPDLGGEDDIPGCQSDQDCEAPADPCEVARCVDRQCIVEAKNCRPDGAAACDEWYCVPATGECVVCPRCNPACQHPCAQDADFCDDGDPCTEDICDPSRGCQHRGTTLPCDDGNACTLEDTCAPDPWGNFVAICTGQTDRNCDDGDPCTVNWCDPELGCVQFRLPAPCDQAPACPRGLDSECPQLGDPCRAFTCVAGLNICAIRNVNGPCNDGNLCTSPDQCVSGFCRPGPSLNCDDGDPCTADTCMPARGCVHTAQDPCSIACEDVEDCLDQYGADANANPCLQWHCTARPGNAGICVLLEQDVLCDDGNACTTGDRCRDGRCRGQARTCTDNDPCTIDSCDPARGCVYQSRGEDCAVADPPCVSGEQCREILDSPLLESRCHVASCFTGIEGLPGSSLCFFAERGNCLCSGPGDNAVCNDGNPCTIDSCVANTSTVQPSPAFYCAHDVDPSGGCCDVPCQDDSGCVDDNKCTDGVCEIPDGAAGGCCLQIYVPSPCGRTCSGDPDCSTGDLLTESRCDPDDGTCDRATPRDCGPFPCSRNQDCVNYGGAFDDGNPCTDSVCIDCGCQHVPNQRSCNDNDACTLQDRCENGQCVGDPRLCPPSDNPDCWRVECFPEDGCRYVWAPVPGACAEQCLQNPAICDDGNPCTRDSCDPDGGCLNESLNTPNKPLACFVMRCESREDCDDGNPCTDDFCVRADAQGQPLPENEWSCQYIAPPGCQVPASVACLNHAACANPRACDADSELACCENDPFGLRSAPICDPTVGCRWLPTEDCLGSCYLATEVEDCHDGDPCTQDICNPFTLECDNSLPTWNPSTNLLNACVPCSDAGPCSPGGDPCVTITCAPLATPSPFDPPGAGTCFAYIDTTTHPNNCEDFDPCTIDRCVAGGCSHVPVEGDCELCYIDADCDDGDPCTAGRCPFDGSPCQHDPVPDCIACESSEDCPSEGCDVRICRERRCESAFGPGADAFCGEVGCLSAADCDDGDAETTDVCLVETGACLWVPAAFMLPCSVAAGCGQWEILPCVRVLGCDAGQCVIELESTCSNLPCSGPGDCAIPGAFSPCESAQCVSWEGGTGCVAVGATLDAGCCDSAADCVVPDADIFPAAAPVCGEGGFCGLSPYPDELLIGGECESAADCFASCEPGETGCIEGMVCFPGTGQCPVWPCATAQCTADHRCLYFFDDCGYCAKDEHCLDTNPCTTDTCVEGACVHTPIIGCSPRTCSASNPCEATDPCQMGICLPDSGCLWFPNGQCE